MEHVGDSRSSGVGERGANSSNARARARVRRGWNPALTRIVAPGDALCHSIVRGARWAWGFVVDLASISLVAVALWWAAARLYVVEVIKVVGFAALYVVACWWLLGCAGYPGNVPCPIELTTYVEGGGGSAFGDRATDVRGGVSVTWDLTGEGGRRCAWDGGGS